MCRTPNTPAQSRRAPTSTPAESTPAGRARHVLVFDGECNLCHWLIQRVLESDRHGHFAVVPIDTPVGHSLLAGHAIDQQRTDSVVLITDDRAYVKAQAALATARRLPWPWPLLTVFRIVPNPLADWVYDQIGRRRYRWFGRRTQCTLPDAHRLDRPPVGQGDSADSTSPPAHQRRTSG